MTAGYRRQSLGAWFLCLGALIGLGVSIFNYFWSGNGIHGSGGALLVIITSAVMLILGGALVRWRASSSWAHGALLALLLIGILSTGFAAYMLEAWWVLAAMVLALIGWLIDIGSDTARQPMSASSRNVAAVAITASLAILLFGPAPEAQGGETPPPSIATTQNAASPAPAEKTTVRYQGSSYTFNGDLMAQKFSAASQITPQNVSHLQKVWEVHTGDVSDGKGKIPASDWSATPLFVNDTVYVGTPFYRIFAIAPDTGKVKWIFKPTHTTLEALTQPDMKSRGVAYWQAANSVAGEACQKIVYIGTMDAKLYAVDADTGKPCDGFGDHGMLDINQWNTVNAKWPLSILQPPTVYKDQLFIGWAGKDWEDSQAPPGTVFAVNAQTGKLNWTFDAIPPPLAKQTGTANVWASMSIDPEHGILYLPVSSPSPNFYGANRTEKLPLATSVAALDVNTGKVLWSRQLVHHDIWDYDIDAAPTLVDLHTGGGMVPALVETTKMGFIFVLNRLTGEPIYPIIERSVPASDVPGEQASPTQPYPTVLEPTVGKFPGVSKLADWASFGECSRTYKKLRHDGLYAPPSVEGTLAYPSTAGGIEWGGGAVDPRSNVYVVNSSAVAQIYRLVPRDKYEKESENSAPGSYFPQTGAPYGFYVHNFVNLWGMPCWKPPYGTLSAYDLDTGKLLWREPFGEVQKWGFYVPVSWAPLRSAHRSSPAAV